MSQKDKLIQRLKSRPKDFTYDEACSLLEFLDYKEFNKGKTSGSRVRFDCKGRESIVLHKPHPRTELKEYQIKQLIQSLEKEELI